MFYLCSTRAPSSFIHVLCIFIYVRTYELCLVRFYRVVYLYHVVHTKRNIYAWPTCHKNKSKRNFTYALKKFTHMCLKIFTHLCIQGWSCALQRFTHLCIDIFYLCCYAWMSHVHSRNLTYASKKFTCAFKKFTCAFKKITRALEDHFYSTNMHQKIYDHACI
jgi:hypothetical protein